MPEGYTPSLEKHRVDLTKFSVYDIKLEKLKAGGEGGGGETPEQQKGTLTVVFKDMDTPVSYTHLWELSDYHYNQFLRHPWKESRRLSYG